MFRTAKVQVRVAPELRDAGWDGLKPLMLDALVRHADGRRIVGEPRFYECLDEVFAEADFELDA